MSSDGTRAVEVECSSAHAGVRLKHVPRVTNHHIEGERDENMEDSGMLVVPDIDCRTWQVVPGVQRPGASGLKGLRTTS